MDLRLPYRLTVGVIGNYLPLDVDGFRLSIRKAIDRILESHPPSDDTEIKLCVLSALCDGSERFAAGEILGLCEGATLKAILPLTISDCLDDLETEAERDDFKRLLSLARHQLSLRDTPLGQEYPDEFISEARRQAYEDVGKLIARNCDVLIVVGHVGAPENGGGGLEKTIAFAQEIKCPTFRIDPNTPGDCEHTEGSGSTETLLAGIEAFNRRVAGYKPETGYIQNFFDSILCSPKTPGYQGVADEIKREIKETLMPYYVTASSLAKKYQRIYRYTGLAVFWLAFGIVVLVSAGIIFFNASPHIFLVEAALLSVISFIIWYAGKKRKSHRNWIEHRFLAERIRSAIFITASNVETHGILVARHGNAAGESDAWMNLAFEEIRSRFPRLQGCDRRDCQALGDFIAKVWIDDQIEFHDKTHRKNCKKSQTLERAGEWVFYAAILVAISHFALPSVCSRFNEWAGAHILTLASMMLPALGATLGAVRSHREYKRLAMRSKKMVLELAELRSRFILLTPRKLESLLRETEQVMLRETLDWLALMKFAELHKAV